MVDLLSMPSQMVTPVAVVLVSSTVGVQASACFRWTTLAIATLAVLSHFGWHLAAYNRLNSLGWRRRTIKRIEKILFVEMWLSLAAIGWIAYGPLKDLLTGEGHWNQVPWLLRGYGIICLAVGGVLGLLWLVWRPIFRIQHVKVARRIEVERADAETSRWYARTKKCRLASHIPGNQMFDLAIEHLEIPLKDLHPSLDGYRIAHLSDIHLTGHVEPDYMKRVVEHANEFESGLMAITGDIVDSQECVDWLPDLFAPAKADDGRYFILGNHDTRVSDPNIVRQGMEASGWTDLGGRCELMPCRDTELLLIGNEYPWFGRPSEIEIEQESMRSEASHCLQLCLSHSPDQFDWARRHRVDLMLCGHTHGGQGRLPIAGPILSPSWHGSRWASGDFYRSPTTMHVSRGLGGVHLLRLRCRPELSLITLRSG